MQLFKISFLVTCIFVSCNLSAISSLKNSTLHVKKSGYIQVNKGKLFYQQFGNDGIPIIVLHGGPGLDQTYLQPHMLALAKQQKVIFYDQRGSGKSLATALNPHTITLTQFTQDLESLRKQLGIKKFILLGHSWGGLLAMNYAIHYPKYIAGMILLSSAPADYKGQQAFEEEFLKRTQPIANKITPLFNFQEFIKLSAREIAELYKTVFSVYFYNPDKVTQLTLDRSRKAAINGEQVMQMMAKTTPPHRDLFPSLTQLTIPTLVIHGEQDIVPLWTAQQIKEAIPGAQILILEKCGHFPYIEQPEQLFSSVHQFIDGLR